MAKGSVWRSIIAPDEVVRIDKSGKEPGKVIGGISTGCEACDLNVMPGLHKFVKAGTEGKPMIWFRSPTRVETTLQSPLKSAAFNAIVPMLTNWGLTADDFEGRFAVKCTPCVNTTKGTQYREAPLERYYIHCLPHTQNLAQLNTRHRAKASSTWIVFGIDTAKQVFEKEYKLDSPVFWSEEHGVKVYVLDHPTPELVEGDTEEAQRWRDRLDAALWSVHNPGRYALLNLLDVRPIYTLAEFQALVQAIRDSGESVSVDIEDDGTGRLLCVGFCYDPAFATVLVLDHPENTRPKDARLLRALGTFLADGKIKKVFQFGSYDAVEFEEKGWPVAGYTYDTFYGSYLSASYYRKHGLEAIAQRHFPYYADYKTVVSKYYEKDITGENTMADRGEAAAGLARCPLKTLLPYNGADAILTKLEEYRTRENIHPELMAVYIGAGKILHKMESNGPLYDPQHGEIVQRVATARLKQIDARLVELTNNPNFNPGSPPQVLYYLHEIFHLPKLSEFDSDFEVDEGEEDDGSTDENSLTRIYAETGHEFPKLILERRKYSGYKDRFKLAYESSAAHWDGEVRTKYHLAGAASGRLRSGGGKRKKDAAVKFVNLQNITRNPFIKNLLCSDQQWRKLLTWAKPVLDYVKRNAPPVGAWDGKKFDVSKDWKNWKKENFQHLLALLGMAPDYILAMQVFCVFDLSQAELRVLALFSRDPELIAMFLDGRDVHALVGEALGLGTYEEIMGNKELRTNIKALNFGLVYGLEAVGLYWYMKGLGATATMEQVEEYRNLYFQRFKGVGRLIEYRHKEWRRQGYIDSPYHFRRWMGPRYEPQRTTSWDNISMNSSIQGTAHMLMLIALHILSIQPKKYALLSGVSMEVHDALVFKTTVALFPQVYPMVQDLLEKQTVRYTQDRFGYCIDVPIVAEGGMGFRYGVESEAVDLENGIEASLLAWILKNIETDMASAAEFGYDA